MEQGTRQILRAAMLLDRHYRRQGPKACLTRLRPSSLIAGPTDPLKWLWPNTGSVSTGQIRGCDRPDRGAGQKAASNTYAGTTSCYYHDPILISDIPFLFRSHESSGLPLTPHNQSHPSGPSSNPQIPVNPKCLSYINPPHQQDLGV